MYSTSKKIPGFEFFLVIYRMSYFTLCRQVLLSG